MSDPRPVDSASAAATPTVLSVLSVVDTAEALPTTLGALQGQTNPHWQWCVVATRSGLFRELTSWAAGDPRVLVLDGQRSDDSPWTVALAAGTGRFVCRLDAGGRFDPNLVAQLAELPEGQWVYTDEALGYPDGVGQQVWFKPAYGPELLRSQPYLVASAMIPLSAARSAGGFDAAAGSGQWYDLVFRVIDEIGPPEQLTGPYYIRATAQDAAGKAPVPPWLDGDPDDLAQVALRAARRSDIAVDRVEPVYTAGRHLGHRLIRTLTRTPKVSIVIPTRGGSSLIYGLPRVHVVEMVRALWTAERYPELEIVVVYDESTPQRVLDDLTELTDGAAVLVPFAGPFHYSRKCNEGALASSGEYLCFLNDDMDVVSSDWLHELVPLLDDPTVGAVGGKLLFADGTLQHAGHTYVGGNAGHLLFGVAGDSVEHGGAAQLTGERAGVTGALLLMRRSDFEELGGFSELFPLNYNDVDLCLKIRANGQRIVYNAHAVLDHFESQTRDFVVDQNEIVKLRRRWHMSMHRDPMINPLIAPKLREPITLPPEYRAG